MYYLLLLLAIHEEKEGTGLDCFV